LDHPKPGKEKALANAVNFTAIAQKPANDLIKTPCAYILTDESNQIKA
jgi:hypothetical protein